MCPSDTFIVVVGTRFAVVDIEIPFIFHCGVNRTVHLFQFDGREVEHRAHPFCRVCIGCIDLPAVDELGRAGEQAVKDMVGEEHVQRVMPVLQGIFVPIQFFVCFTGSGICLIQSEDAGGSVVCVLFCGQVVQCIDLLVHGHAFVETVGIFFVQSLVRYDEKGKSAVPVVRSFAHVVFVADVHALCELFIVVFPYFVVVVTVT